MVCDLFKYLEQVTDSMVDYFLFSVLLLFLYKIFFTLYPTNSSHFGTLSDQSVSFAQHDCYAFISTIHLCADI